MLSDHSSTVDTHLFPRLVPMSSPMYSRLATQAMPDIMDTAHQHYHAHGHFGNNSRIAFVTDTRDLLMTSERGSVDGCSETDTPCETGPGTLAHRVCDGDLMVSTFARARKSNHSRIVCRFPCLHSRHVLHCFDDFGRVFLSHIELLYRSVTC